MASEGAPAPVVVDQAEEEFEVHPKYQGDKVERIVRFLLDDNLSRIGGIVPDVAIVCGTGLSHLSQRLTDKITLKYEDIPNFPQSTVRGHSGELVFGNLGGKRVVCARGRFHYYEGYSPAKVGSLIRVIAGIGARVLIVTNAAGGVNPGFSVGDIALIDDHIFFPGIAGQHPLVGTNDDRFGVRFPPLSRAYDAGLQQLAIEAAAELGKADSLRQGAVYACVSGPSYETPHEIKMLRTLGCDQVGMSTIQEVVVAAHCNLRVLGLSVITNKCLAPEDDRSIIPTHTEVVEAGVKAGETMQSLVQLVLQKLDISACPSTRAGNYFAKLVKSPMVVGEPEGEAEKKKGCCGKKKEAAAAKKASCCSSEAAATSSSASSGHSTCTMLACALVAAIGASLLTRALAK